MGLLASPALVALALAVTPVAVGILIMHIEHREHERMRVVERDYEIWRVMSGQANPARYFRQTAPRQRHP